MNPLIETHRDELADLCRRFLVRRLELFGSAATDRFDPVHSDLDFLVEFLPEAEPRLAALYLDLIAALRNLFGREVDVVVSRAIRDPLFHQALERSRVMLYAA